MPLDLLRQDTESFLRAVKEEEYLQRAGLKAESQLANVYERYQGLWEPARIEEVRAEVARNRTADGPRLLLEFLTHTALEAGLREVTDRFLSEEAGTSISVEERTIPLRGADAAIRNEPNRARRARLEDARTRAIDRLNPLLRERRCRLEDGVARFGAMSYAALWQELSGIRLDELEKQAEELLARTEEMYADVLKWALKRTLGVPLAEARRHDLAHLLRGAEFDRLLPSEAIADIIETAAKKMRIDPRAGGRIQIDADARPTKSPRAFVAPIEVPQRVVLVIRPAGGWADFQAYLHELGHAL
ncbi:MAG: hypothetical protein ACREJ4_10665, partial [Candidatus Methylomirabilaceae bacterium]